MDCIFCDLINSELEYVVAEDDMFLIIPDRDSLGYGHCMIIPKQHVTKVYELDEHTYDSLFRLARDLAQKLEKITKKRAVAYTAFGSGLPHAHLHLIPHDDTDVLIHPAKYSQRKSPGELRDMAKALKDELMASS